jgi:preprotein translocase subunit SecG
MNVLLTAILAIQLLAALAMIALVLIQHGKGADMGAAFGGGSAGSLFGASGSANFLSRATGVLAAVFFVCTLALAYFGNLRPAESGSVLDRAAGVPAPAASGVLAPQVPASGAAQIPGTSMPAATPASTGAAAIPASPASGAAQIPSK